MKLLTDEDIVNIETAAPSSYVLDGEGLPHQVR